MPRRTLQRIVRLSPDAARLAWGALPGGAKAALSPLVHPIASGERQRAIPLEVEVPSVRPRFDVVVAAGVELPEDTRDQLRREGHRVFDADASELHGLARGQRVLDAVLLGDSEGCDAAREARKLGWRVTTSAREMSRSFPEVSIVIPTHAARDLCRSCLASILHFTGWANYRVVVVDDASRDGTRDMLRALARREAGISLVRLEKRVGFPRAVNAGLARSSGRYVVLLNDDTVVGPGWLSRLVAALERNPDVGMVCPVTNQIANQARIDVDYATLDEMATFAYERAFEQGGELAEAPSLALFCAALERAALEALGGLDERYDIGLFEDDDLSMAIRRSGQRLAIALDAFVHHVGQATFGKLDDAAYLTLWETNKRRFEEKWGVTWRPPVE
ncbi:MAG: glycosyltransferase family 2 protein [Polyangiaceae bacterium]